MRGSGLISEGLSDSAQIFQSPLHERTFLESQFIRIPIGFKEKALIEEFWKIWELISCHRSVPLGRPYATCTGTMQCFGASWKNSSSNAIYSMTLLQSDACCRHKFDSSCHLLCEELWTQSWPACFEKAPPDHCPMEVHFWLRLARLCCCFSGHAWLSQEGSNKHEDF